MGRGTEKGAGGQRPIPAGSVDTAAPAAGMRLPVAGASCVANTYLRKMTRADEGMLPRYEFLCEKCNKPFEAIMTFSEREKGEVKSPKCQGTKFAPQVSEFVAQMGKKTPEILYGLADRIRNINRETAMRTVLLVILILILLGALPLWPYSSGWGYYPSGGVGLLLIILIVLAAAGRL